MAPIGFFKFSCFRLVRFLPLLFFFDDDDDFAGSHELEGAFRAVARENELFCCCCRVPRVVSALLFYTSWKLDSVPCSWLSSSCFCKFVVFGVLLSEPRKRTAVLTTFGAFWAGMEKLLIAVSLPPHASLLHLGRLGYIFIAL